MRRVGAGFHQLSCFVQTSPRRSQAAPRGVGCEHSRLAHRPEPTATHAHI
jgi:hypothetical protein